MSTKNSQKKRRPDQKDPTFFNFELKGGARRSLGARRKRARSLFLHLLPPNLSSQSAGGLLRPRRESGWFSGFVYSLRSRGEISTVDLATIGRLRRWNRGRQMAMEVGGISNGREERVVVGSQPFDGTDIWGGWTKLGLVWRWNNEEVHGRQPRWVNGPTCVRFSGWARCLCGWYRGPFWQGWQWLVEISGGECGPWAFQTLLSRWAVLVKAMGIWK